MQALDTGASPSFTGLDITGLTDNYVPYIGSGALADSPMRVASGKTGISGTPFFYSFESWGNCYSSTYPFSTTICEGDRVYNDTTPPPGGGLGFFGKRNSSGAYSTFAGIVGRKENTTSDDYRGYLGFYVFGAAMGEAIRINSYGSLCMGVTACGTSATKTIGVGSGTPPSSSPADMMQIYSADQAAGNACFHTRTEGGAVIKLYQQAHIADATDAATVITRCNAILAALENVGFLATS